MPQTTSTVVHNDADSRFEMALPGGLAVLEYQRDGDRLDLVHTKVPESDEGQGYGTALVHFALDYARREHLRVIPSCPFVRAHVGKHPEDEDVLAP